MSMKTLFFLLFAYSLTYVSQAQPIEENIRERRSSTGEEVSAELYEIEERSFFGKAGDAVTNWWNTLTGKKSKQQKEKLEELQRRYEALREDSEAAIQAKREEVEFNVQRQENKVNRVREQGEEELQMELEFWKIQFEELDTETDEFIQSMN